MWPCLSNLAAPADIQPTSVARCVSYVAGWERAEVGWEVREEEGVEILNVIYHSVPLYVWAMHPPPCTTVQWPPELRGPILTVGKGWGRDSSVPPALSVTPATPGYRRFLASISHPGNGINPFTAAAGKKTASKRKKKNVFFKLCLRNILFQPTSIT